MAIEFIAADWAAPSAIHCVQTTRRGGVSLGGFAALNLAAHVGDEPAAVAENRRRLVSQLTLPSEPLWLKQVHGTDCVAADSSGFGTAADASHTRVSGVVCAVLTADCLPVALCSRDGGWLAVAHAGWRGLLAGVLETTVRSAPAGGGELIAWLGAAIGPHAFEVGPEVRSAFVAYDRSAAAAFVRGRGDRWQADLYALARQRLAHCGIRAVSGGDACTFGEAERYFSFRREPRCGRMATLIWRD